MKIGLRQPETPHSSPPDTHFPRLPCSKAWSCDTVLANEIQGETYWEEGSEKDTLLSNHRDRCKELLIPLPTVNMDVILRISAASLQP